MEVRYALKGGHTGESRLEVFDVRGARVRTVPGATVPGRHRFVWLGEDDSGRTVGSGVYFVRLRAGEESRTRKVVMVR